MEAKQPGVLVEFGPVNSIRQPAGDPEAVLDAICIDEEALAEYPIAVAVADSMDPPHEPSTASAGLFTPFRK